MRHTLTLALIAAAAIVVAAACGGGGNGDSGPGDFSNETVRERDGVRLRLSSDRAEYTVGQTVYLRAEVQNLTLLGMLYGAAADPSETAGLKFAVTNDWTGEQRVEPAQRAEAEKGGTLAPQGATSMEVQWDQQFATYVTPIQAPAGTYSVTASLLIKPQGAAAPIAVSAALDIRLTGGDPVPVSDTVIQAAIAQEEVKEWFEGRGDSVICTTTREGIFFNAVVGTGAIAETFDFVYQAQIRNGGVICSTVVEGEFWRVIFSDTQGPEPSRVSAIMDLNTADFVRLEEGAPTPAPATPQPSPTPSP